MTQAKIWKLDDPDLPRELHTIRYVFTGQYPDDAPEEPETPQEAPKEGLHNYLTRKGIKCFCPECRKKEGKNANTQGNGGNGPNTRF